MDDARAVDGSKTEPVRDTDAGRKLSLGVFRFENLIGQSSLDIDVHPRQALRTWPVYDVLVLDPGKTVGWAGIVSTSVYRESRRVGDERHIEVGQGPWHSCLAVSARYVYVERSPFAARRNFDPWPIRYEGAVRAEIFPQEPLFVEPTVLDVANHWFRLPLGHGLGVHAKDALAHLVHLLATGRVK